jgi:hypothetical protein
VNFSQTRQLITLGHSVKGRICAICVIGYFGQWFEYYRSIAHFWTTFSHGPSYVFILTKMDWATFSPTHLVTLVKSLDIGV